MKEGLLTRFTPKERARLIGYREQVKSGQRSEFPNSWAFAKRLRGQLLEEEFHVPDLAEDSAATKAVKAHLEQAKLGMLLQEQAEDIRARVEARVKDNHQALRLVIADRDKGLPVTTLGMRLTLKGKSEKDTEKEIINLGIVVGTGDGWEDGTVSISYLMIEYKSNQWVEIKAKILKGGKFSVRRDAGYFGDRQSESRGYSVVYPREVLGDGQATKFLHMLEFLVDRCLTQPNLSFHPQRGDSRRALLK